jgi:hypothetical protein
MFPGDLQELSFNHIPELDETEEDDKKLKEILQKHKIQEFQEIDEEQVKKAKIHSLKQSLELNLNYKQALELQISQLEEKMKANEASQRNLRLMTSMSGATRPSNSKKYNVSVQKRSADSYFFVDASGKRKEF